MKNRQHLRNWIGTKKISLYNKRPFHLTQHWLNTPKLKQTQTSVIFAYIIFSSTPVLTGCLCAKFWSECFLLMMFELIFQCSWLCCCFWECISKDFFDFKRFIAPKCGNGRLEIKVKWGKYPHLSFFIITKLLLYDVSWVFTKNQLQLISCYCPFNILLQRNARKQFWFAQSTKT